jgi:hypothetical protein
VICVCARSHSEDSFQLAQIAALYPSDRHRHVWLRRRASSSHDLIYAAVNDTLPTGVDFAERVRRSARTLHREQLN